MPYFLTVPLLDPATLDEEPELLELEAEELPETVPLEEDDDDPEPLPALEEEPLRLEA